MSLIMTVHVSEGIVMASDSRMVYSNSTEKPLPKGMGKVVVQNNGVHFSDSSYKTFLTPNNIGISVCGESSIKNKPIAGYLETFIRENKDTQVTDMPKAVIDYFNALVPNLESVFHIAGYQKLGNELKQYVYRVSTKDGNIEQVDTANQGAAWNGENDVLSRLFTPLYIKNSAKDDTYTEHTGFPIIWQYFTLQDAVEFAQFAMRTTIDTMKFQLRVKSVGGPIDLLIIKPDSASWISHKELHI